jgi:hypothetical protein
MGQTKALKEEIMMHTSAVVAQIRGFVISWLSVPTDGSRDVCGIYYYRPGSKDDNSGDDVSGRAARWR